MSPPRKGTEFKKSDWNWEGSRLWSDRLRGLLADTLYRPIEDLYARPSKRFRARLVEAGFALGGGQMSAASGTAAALNACAEALEALHAGSLIVDDIEDGSRFRRGAPSLHVKYGLAPALNAGNWLYFWPLERLRDLGLPANTELALYRLCHRALLRAHFGQAIDVGVPIDTLEQELVPEVCLASLGLKSGALTALALLLGASIAGAEESVLDQLETFGQAFGVALQMLDDLGNLETHDDKRFEDFYLRRPSWIWAHAAATFSAQDYARLVHAVSTLPDESFLRPLLELHEVRTRARAGALQRLESALQSIRRELPAAPEAALASLEDLGRALAGAYS